MNTPFEIEMERLFYIAVNATALSRDILRSDDCAAYVKSAATVQLKAAEALVRAYLDKKATSDLVIEFKQACALLNGTLVLQTHLRGMTGNPQE